MKLPNPIVVLFAILPLTACGKSEEEMCFDTIKHIWLVEFFERTALKATKEIKEEADFHSEKAMDMNIFNKNFKKCVNSKEMTKKKYECAMKSKSSQAISMCDL